MWNYGRFTIGMLGTAALLYFLSFSIKAHKESGTGAAGPESSKDVFQLGFSALHALPGYMIELIGGGEKNTDDDADPFHDLSQEIRPNSHGMALSSFESRMKQMGGRRAGMGGGVPAAASYALQKTAASPRASSLASAAASVPFTPLMVPENAAVSVATLFFKDPAAAVHQLASQEQMPSLGSGTGVSKAMDQGAKSKRSNKGKEGSPWHGQRNGQGDGRERVTGTVERMDVTPSHAGMFFGKAHKTESSRVPASLEENCNMYSREAVADRGTAGALHNIVCESRHWQDISEHRLWFLARYLGHLDTCVVC